jgi:hypothetical protein
VPLILAASPSLQKLSKSSPLRDSCPSARLSSLQSRLYSAASVQSRDTNPPRESFACGPYAVGHRARRSKPAQCSMGLPPRRIHIVAKMRPRSRPVRACPGTDAPDGPPTIDAMPLEIHTQPDPDQLCETCGGPSELVSHTITSWDGNETMAREVSPWTPRCADPWCQSRRPRHSKMSDTRVCGH